MTHDDIIKDLIELIYDVNQMAWKINRERHHAVASLVLGINQDAHRDAAAVYEDGLRDAEEVLKETEKYFEEMKDELSKMIEKITYDALSDKVQGGMK